MTLSVGLSSACREQHLEQVAGADPVGLAGGLVVELDVAGGGEVGGLGARDPEQPGEGGVDALALEPVGDEEGAASVSDCPRRPRGDRGARCRPSTTDATQREQPIRTAAPTMRDVGDVADEQAEVSMKSTT